MRYLNRFGIDIEAVLKLITMLGFAVFFYVVIETGSAQYYVHPRLLPYMRFAIGAFVIISLFIFKGIYGMRSRREVRVLRYLLFIVPLICAFTLPPRTLDTEYLSLGKVNALGISTLKQGSTAPAIRDNAAKEKNTPNDFAEGVDENSDRLSLLDEETIVLDEKNFIFLIMEIFEEFDKYQGKKIEVVGFVFKDKTFGKNEFVPARFMVSCCAADMQPIGLLCDYDGASELKKEEWVRVTGVLKSREYEGEVIPIIEAQSVETVAKPKNEFVFP